MTSYLGTVQIFAFSLIGSSAPLHGAKPSGANEKAKSSICPTNGSMTTLPVTMRGLEPINVSGKTKACTTESGAVPFPGNRRNPGFP